MAEPIGKEKMRPSPGPQEPHGQGRGETGKQESTRTVCCVLLLWSMEGSRGAERRGICVRGGGRCYLTYIWEGE